MLKTLAWKESRELLPPLTLGLAAQGLLLVSVWRSIITDVQNIFPFYNDPVPPLILFVGTIGAIVIGFWQTSGELNRGTFHFLLHRPVERTSIFGIKLLVGTFATLSISGVPLLGYALWADTHGTHASPFFWSMTTLVWTSWLCLPVFYLGAFLSGLRPGRWFGSRVLPLGCVCLIMIPIASLGQWPSAIILASSLLAVCFLIVIQFVAATRDYS